MVKGMMDVDISTNCAVGIFKTITYNGFGLGEEAEFEKLKCQ